MTVIQNQFMKKNKTKNYYWKDLDIIPDLSAVAREMTDKSQVQIVFYKISKLPISKIILFTLNNILYTFDIFNKDFACGIKILTELELLSQKKRKKIYFFNSQIVDTAVAFKNKKLINNLIKLSEIYHFYPVFITYNLKNFLFFCENSGINIRSKGIAFPSINSISVSEEKKLIEYSGTVAYRIENCI